MTKELFDGIGFAIVAGVIALCMANPMKASFEILPAPAEPRILKTDVTRDVTGNMADCGFCELLKSLTVFGARSGDLGYLADSIKCWR